MVQYQNTSSEEKKGEKRSAYENTEDIMQAEMESF